MVADELRRQADIFVDLADMRDELERAQSTDRPRSRPRDVMPLDDDVDDELDDEEEDEDYYESQPA